MRLRPAPENFGIRFCRTDLPGHPVVEARYDQVVQTEMATTLGANGIRVTTIEHLLAALLGYGIDNVFIELDAPEVPIFDGSAAPYLAHLKQAGSRKQQAFRRYLRVRQSFNLRDGDAFIRVTPADALQIVYTIDFAHPLVGKQTISWNFDQISFARDIAGARTFGFLKDLSQLQAMGLARGGSLANAIVFDDRGVLNREGFRFDDECVRHKILDLMGDIALAGTPILGRFEAYKAGHTLHNRFLRQLISRPQCYEMAPALPSQSFFPFQPPQSVIRGIAPLAVRPS